MAKLFGNLNLVVVVGIVVAIIIMMAFNASAQVDVNSVFRWLHVFFGIMWIGLLYYFNFVQVPTMPKIPAEQKGGVTGFIAPSALFFFRWAALLTLITGLVVGWVSGYIVDALLFRGTGNVMLIGIGMWFGVVMAFNVWFIIWPAQKKVLGLVEASDEEKASAAPRALIASRLNTLLSIPLIYCMVSANLG